MSKKTIAQTFAATAAAALFVFQPTGEANAETIRVGLDWAWRPYHAPFIVAYHKGYYEEAGLDVTLEEGRGSNNTAIMVGQDTYDLGHLNVTNAAHAISRGVPLKIVAVYQPRTAASFVGLDEKVDLNDAESLKQYRIGSTPGGSDQLSLAIFQAANDISPDELDVISLDANTKTAALLAGEIDVVSGDSYAYLAIVKGAGHEPEALLLADYGVPLLGFGFAVNPDFAEKSPEAIRTFLEVTKKAFQEVAADPVAACEYSKSKIELPGDLDQCVNYMTNLLDLSTDPHSADWGRTTEEQWVKLLGALEEHDQIEPGYEVGSYYTNDFIPE